MSNSDKILEIILNAVKNEYKDDVSLVCCYGSYVNGTANEQSDIDFYFIPKTDRAWELSKTFIIDGIGYDFWGANWERLERMANFDDTFVSLIDGAKIVYSHSEKEENRFNELKEKISKTANSPVNADMLSKALFHIGEAEKYYFSLISSNDRKSNVLYAGEILIKISDAVCLMNNSFFRYGTKKHFDELSSLKHLPHQFADNYNSIVNSKDNSYIENACFNLISSAKKLYEDLHAKVISIKNPNDCLCGLYEEISSNFNKIYKACDENNASLAFMTGIFLQGELDGVLSDCGIPQTDFISEYNSDNLGIYKKAVKKAEDYLLLCLKKYQIPINQYNTVQEFESALLVK